MTAKTAQPAIKSYFFDKGYKDLGNTIMDSWKMNLQSAQFYWNHTQNFWNRGNVWMLVAVAAVLSAFSVVVFGTLWFVVLSIIHIVILAIVFLIIYVSFSIFWIIERVYMLIRGIFTVCPTCHTKSDLPYYLCPNCNAVHTSLIPNSYGILKRTCLCGEKLPTTFWNGRGKLEARCPNPDCSRAIEPELYKPLCIPIIGGPSVGKTCFLFSVTNKFKEEVAPNRSWTVRFLNQKNQNQYNSLLAGFQKGVVPAKTVALNPTAFNFYICSPKWTPDKLVYLYDAAGEAFQSSEDLLSHKFYGYLHGFLFIIDPFSIPAILDEYEQNLKLYNAQIKPSDLMIEDCFNTLLINLEKHHKIKRDQQISKPCAVIINKIDAFDLEDRIGMKAAQKLMNSRPDVQSIEKAVEILCEEIFLDWGLGNFLRSLKQKFKNYRFFTCSALGHIPDDSGNSFSQERVSDPFLWILEKSDSHFRS